MSWALSQDISCENGSEQQDRKSQPMLGALIHGSSAILFPFIFRKLFQNFKVNYSIQCKICIPTIVSFYTVDLDYFLFPSRTLFS